MSASLPKRITKEIERLINDPAPGISATPHEDNLRYFDVVICGPDQSPFEGGKFKLELFLPEEYPMAPPKVRFLTKMYHPNIDKLGRICLDILKDRWSPALQIRTVLLSIQALMSAPNPDDPLANDVAQHWKENEKAAIQTELVNGRPNLPTLNKKITCLYHFEFIIKKILVYTGLGAYYNYRNGYTSTVL
ncbi:hypothetical protein CONCODRAFT_78782 [Conidiobolus coronatus NRRL 28638]|uniref:E2 ubiquitin-conjugating enzyme n=1 Tax=Conidiobolus coronatus (strain ATCC 28846 / CBS 209.66 / NRRL 28638) TaxID=796925 RepID=A0A137P6H8_CONC2|nr:hypothetical protein CONCODRAFT_78782 [Conidiobolus coronatus NRRL 28638]|eukprot:KXN70521.1 hypothetical protein CONCODRAFT_78782 [Conidiobolus coronatus NRRL 28638]